MLPAQERCRGIARLIEQKQYFVIHAARQTGKTTLLLELEADLNTQGECYALYCSLEAAQNISEPERGIPIIVDALRKQIRFRPWLQAYSFAPAPIYTRFATVLQEELAAFCQQLDKPLVVFFDEVDCLSNGTLITFLRQLRDGYINRLYMPFPRSVGLIGMRNIRDYKAQVRDDGETLGSASPFNIVSKALTLRNFTAAEIGRLYAQHTAETGQAFPPEVVDVVFRMTQGQPWLVNAIANEIVQELFDFDYTRVVTPAEVEQAVQTLILRRPTHIDSLMERLREARVQRIVEPVILGQAPGVGRLDDDYQYVLDLGILREVDKRLEPANPIYAEVLMRKLSDQAQTELDTQQYPPEAPAYLVEGRLDMRRLLGDFQAFWREHSEMWVERFDYKEAAPHLVLQAFLQRVVNSGGRIGRELAAGSGRLDTCMEYGGERYPMELKLRYGPQTYAEGVAQLTRYLERLGCVEGWLVVFDRRASVPWSEKLFWRTQQVDDQTIHIVGC